MSKRLLNNVITVDPGIHTGWAYWLGTSLPLAGGFEINKSFMKTSNECKLDELIFRFSKVLDEYKPSKVFIEGAELWSGSLRSLTSAKTGKLFFLSFCIGGYYAVSSNEFGCITKLIYPSQWKGQLSKDAVKKRIIRINDMEYADEHITDAVGMGFGIVGRL